VKYTSLANAMRDLTEKLAARTSATLYITDPLAGAAPADTAPPKNFVDAATGVVRSESGTLADVSYLNLDEAVKAYEQRTNASPKPIGETVAEGLEAGRSLEDISSEVHARLGKHHAAHLGEHMPENDILHEAAAPAVEAEPAPLPQPPLRSQLPQHAADIKPEYRERYLRERQLRSPCLYASANSCKVA
jgi:hypothetical protein